MSIYNQDPIEFSRIATYSLYERPGKVTVRDFATPLTDEQARATAALLDLLPKNFRLCRFKCGCHNYLRA